jgi:hypothetical protein
MPGARVGIEIETAELDRLMTAASGLGEALDSDALKQAMGGAMHDTIVENFRVIALDSQHHQSAQSLGAQPTGFYVEAQQNTQPARIQSDGVSVSIDQEGLAQRYFGGDISARPGSFLTIPARGEAYGHRAREFPFLKLIKFPSGLYALIDSAEEQHEGSVWYWLVRSVHQQADPSILPTDEQIIGAAIAAGSEYVDQVWEQQLAA